MTVYEVGKELRRIRRAMDLTQEAIGVLSTVAIHRIEKGSRGKTRFESVEKYAEELGYELVLQKLEAAP